jgi:hypothetical protein
MPSEAAKALPGSASSFAKLFAGLTRSKGENAAASSDSWIDDALTEDVATISYEQALRAHARYRHTEPLPSAPPETTDPTVPKPPQSVRITEWAPNDTSAALAASRKLSSITIRMSRAECDQLRQRAAAAGLTVSAYLRSCIFEVEALRAQVKDALSGLHSEPAQPHAEQSENRDKPASADWRARLFAHLPRSRNRADA